MNWTIYPISEMDSKWEDWDRLNGLYYNHHPYFDSRFIKPCVKFFSEENDKLAELQDDYGNIKGMLLLSRKRLGLWSLFVPSQLQIAPVLLPVKEISEQLRSLIKAISGYCWMFEILYQDPLNTPINDSLLLRHSKIIHCTTTKAILNTDFETFWNDRPKKFKQNIRTAFNRLEKDKVEYYLSVKTSPEEIIQGVKNYGLLESKTWKGEEGTAIHPENIQGEFYQEVLERFSKTGHAAVYELYIDNKLAGSILSVSNNQMFILLKTTFNEEFKAYSPGRLIQYKFLEHEFNCKRFEVMEAYTNANKDQKAWSTAMRDIFHMEIYRNRTIETIINFKRGI